MRPSPSNATTGGPPRRATRVLLLIGSGVLAVGLVAGILIGTRGEDTQANDATECRGLPDGPARACYARAFTASVSGREDPRPAVEAIAASARREGGFLLSNCHGVMHTVGRLYAREAGLTPARLMDYLPRSNDPGCSAGFAHGLVTGAAPAIDPRRPRAAAAVCAGAETRYRRYSCVHGFGHAFMRINADRLAPALDLCRALGAQAAADCAQGAYHDYWFAVVGADDARLQEESPTDPRTLCGSQPRAFVRPCWYRAFVDNRPDGFVLSSRDDFEGLCGGLERLQRQACVTAASVVGPPDPADQLALCSSLPNGSDAEACIRGTKVQNLLGSSTAAYVGLIRRCELFVGAARAACYRWLGKTLAVVTDGEFGRAGCRQLVGAEARRGCEAGARRIDEPLVTFS